MGRNKKYDSTKTLAAITDVFIQNGYNGTSLDDLVKATGLLRGSLYSQFGSKQGMFNAALAESLRQQNDQLWGLLLVAMLEVTSKNKTAFDLVQKWYQHNHDGEIAEQIGLALIKRSGIQGDENGK
ncbi:TetR/AcrR family transcriptional regulator [Eupransor demetentiae]|uniref:AcrR family n=1 Tax=Eupransor demetentiae TaxID=3109584 RepID=A0ABM9N419_9LACO|nr:AcrR family [Lactobacillaceae bacterium LMG 33000]